jgi:hypothetical protein
MAHFSGGCLCGKVKYSADADPIFMGVCHCTDCQRGVGATFNAVVAVPEPALRVQGTPKVYVGHGDTGKAVSRRFCADCGASLFTTVEMMPGVAMLTTGTLDDASQFKPTMQIYCDSAQPWVKLGGEMQSFPKMPGPPG